MKSLIARRMAAARRVATAAVVASVLVEPSGENARRVMRALAEFGVSTAGVGLTADDLTRPGLFYQIGIAPRRIDLLTEISGVGFEEAWRSRVRADFEGDEVGFLGRDALLRSKRAPA